MHKQIAFTAALLAASMLASVAAAQCDDGPRGLLPLALARHHGQGWQEEGYRGHRAAQGYAGPEVYGYWADYGWFGPQYGGWYGPGGWNYYSRTGDYAAPFLPPPSMRGPPPY